MSRISELQDVGQSIWFDYIERRMVQSGELKEASGCRSARGHLKSQPSFNKPSPSSNAYEDDLRRLVNRKSTARPFLSSWKSPIFRLRRMYCDRSMIDPTGCDGFVSIEVAPDLAYDCEATVAEARRLHAAVNRPNVMIKVPATQEGIEAIRQLISDGINVNVTLIFALQRYAAVKEAYLSGLEDRLEKNLPIDHISSVASFFISRVDSNVDGHLQKLAQEQPAHG